MYENTQLSKHAIINREMVYFTDDGSMVSDYEIGQDKRTSGVAVVNISDSDEVLYNVLKISCDSLGKYIDYGVKQSLLNYMSDDRFIFEFTKDRITIRVEDIGYAIIMWTLLDRRVRVSKSGENGIIETKKEDLYFV